ncbi:FAD-binding oxidoreductase [Flavisolibacter ginsengisoli]|jgi:FAD/FMN-containing dehydrogenase|uniref:FAD/FMN-containing dehydrogenase n=1 Tax=Flavisolibacter ginsengisoli DSM 18119 TaxID=1121884 RepID=A0A1M4ZLX5_9BACT|nr:FAD-binding oxidoreductase [Flavisolibacter ginsengisoli]SHF19004.1 FAD/FMN-containing dehydrogenase [Flavisolibacter ginsengisoli DSM 18119]
MIATTKTRREFIKQTALATGMFAIIGGCEQKSWRSLLDPEAIKKFRKRFSGNIILPGDKEYETVRRVPWMNPKTDRYPAIIGQCNNKEDVLRCVDLANQHDLEVAVRSGNHSFMGWGTCDRGIVIDLSKMKHITIDPVKKTVNVATGNISQEISDATASYGLEPVLGECGSVGAGLVLGGGLGWLSGKYGAACDNLISASIITADARVLKADISTNPDLFWAIRGGGGNFGIATSYEYQLHPVGEVLAGGFSYPVSKARDMLRFYRDFLATAPDELQGCCFLTAEQKFSVVFVYAGDLAAGEKLIDKFRSLSHPVQDWMKRRAYAEIYTLAPYSDNGIVNPFKAQKGSYIEQLSDEVIDLILDRFAQPPPAKFYDFVFDHYMHGEVCRVAPDATAFGLRKAGAIHLSFGLEWQDPKNTAACMSWHAKTLELLQQYSGGRIYSNYMSTEGEQAVKAVYGANYPRLVSLKKTYDPQSFFHRNQNVLLK